MRKELADVFFFFALFSVCLYFLYHENPVVIYGVASAVGAYAAKFATLINIHPRICVAGKGIPFVETMLGEGGVIIDYRKDHECAVEEMRKALKGLDLKYAFDIISEHGSQINLS